jgi:hypothetical protein
VLGQQSNQSQSIHIKAYSEGVLESALKDAESVVSLAGLQRIAADEVAVPIGASGRDIGGSERDAPEMCRAQIECAGIVPWWAWDRGGKRCK